MAPVIIHGTSTGYLSSRCFEHQLCLASDLSLPLFLHLREAFDDFYGMYPMYVPCGSTSAKTDLSTLSTSTALQVPRGYQIRRSSPFLHRIPGGSPETDRPWPPHRHQWVFYENGREYLGRAGHSPRTTPSRNRYLVRHMHTCTIHHIRPMTLSMLPYNVDF